MAAELALVQQEQAQQDLAVAKEEQVRQRAAVEMLSVVARQPAPLVEAPQQERSVEARRQAALLRPQPRDRHLLSNKQRRRPPPPIPPPRAE